MIRGILSGLFTPDQARHHLGLIREHLLAPDGARLFDRPPRYRGGTTHYFQRAESAAYFGREVGLMYTHAHLRYAQALAHLGLADDFYHALLVVNPVGLRHAVSNALPRQANMYFSSSDAAFANRREAERRYDDLMQGDVPVHGGWRLYSSGPGLFLNLITTHLLGLQPHGQNLTLDPVLPASLNQLTATTSLHHPARGPVPLTLHYTLTTPGSPPRSVTLNSRELTPLGPDTLGLPPNPYRPTGPTFALDEMIQHLNPDGANTLEVNCD